MIAPKPSAAKTLFTFLLVFAFVVPVAVLVVQSAAARWPWPRVLPESWSPRSFVVLAAQSGMIAKSLGSSLLYSLAAVALSLVLCIAPAAALVRGDLPRRPLVEALLMAPVMVPPVTFTLGIHHVFLRMGLVDSWLGVTLVLTAFAYPYMLRSLMGGYEAMGEGYTATAGNLGAGRFRRTFQIEIPLLLPAIVAGGSVVFLVAFSDYYLVFLIGGGAVPSYSGYLFPFLTSSDRPVAALLSILFLLLPITLFLILEVTVSRWYRSRGMG